jgi:hypothetical protein
MSRAVPEQEFIDYLSGKSIAVVGNARTIRERGKEIDAHDIVIRFNNCKIEGYEKLVGTKTDIWVSAANGVAPTKIPHTYHWYTHGTVATKNPEYPVRIVTGAIFVGKEGDILYKQLVLSTKPLFLNVDGLKSTNEILDKSPDLQEWRKIANTHPTSGTRVMAWLYNRGFQFNLFGFDGSKSVSYFQQPHDERKESIVVAHNPYHDLNAEVKFLELMHKNRKVEAVVYDPLYEDWAKSKFEKVHNAIQNVHHNSIVAIVRGIMLDSTIRKMITHARKEQIVQFGKTKFAPRGLL